MQGSEGATELRTMGQQDFVTCDREDASTTERRSPDLARLDDLFPVWGPRNSVQVWPSKTRIQQSIHPVAAAGLPRISLLSAFPSSVFPTGILPTLGKSG